MGARSPDRPKQSDKPRQGQKAVPNEASCEVQIGKGRARETRRGKAVLGDDAVHFHTGRTGRGGKDFSLRIRYDEVRKVEADATAGTLTVVADDEQEVVFHIGRFAAEWKKRIADRPSRLAELGVTASSRVAVVAVDDDRLLAELVALVPGFDADAAGDGLDVLFVGVEHRADLPRLAELLRRVKRPGGLIWAVFRLGGRGPTEAEIESAGRAAGLVAGHWIELGPKLGALRLMRM